MTISQLPENWRKSSYSGQDTNCVEVGLLAGGAAVRDTKDRGAGYITATAGQWRAFVSAIKTDRFA